MMATMLLKNIDRNSLISKPVLKCCACTELTEILSSYVHITINVDICIAGNKVVFGSSLSLHAKVVCVYTVVHSQGRTSLYGSIDNRISVQE